MNALKESSTMSKEQGILERFFQSNFVTVLVSFATAALIEVIVYPQVFIAFNTNFVIWDDYNVEYAPAFILTTFFYQGGLQLWDYFGQMPSFSYLRGNGFI